MTRSKVSENTKSRHEYKSTVKMLPASAKNDKCLPVSRHRHYARTDDDRVQVDSALRISTTRLSFYFIRLGVASEVGSTRHGVMAFNPPALLSSTPPLRQIFRRPPSTSWTTTVTMRPSDGACTTSYGRAAPVGEIFMPVCDSENRVRARQT